MTTPTMRKPVHIPALKIPSMAAQLLNSNILIDNNKMCENLSIIVVLYKNNWCIKKFSASMHADREKLLLLYLFI